jgi:LmbE family N-acetylglucosaminyl deacetylase
MNTPLRLLCVLAHPDDESLGTGGILARYAAEGVETSLLMATRGERGWQGDERDNPGPQALARLREAELQAAAKALGLRRVRFLNYLDGELDQADADEVVAAIARHIRLLRPDVVVTFGPEGATGHPDHIAISQLTTTAVMCAADCAYRVANAWPPHRVAKLYYLAESRQQAERYTALFGDTAMTVDGVRRSFGGWENWAITTRVDTAPYWRQVWRAIGCHQSQLPGYAALAALPEAQHQALWGVGEFYRAFSRVNAGRAVEDDLFAGLR